MSHAQAARLASRQAPGDWLARMLSRRSVRWAVVIVWLAVIALFSGFGNALSKVTNNSAAAYLPASAQSTRVANLEEQALRGAGQPQSDQAIVVFARNSGRLRPADLAEASVAVTPRPALSQLLGLTLGGRASRARPRLG